MKERAQTLKALQALLRKEKSAFYNHPALLKEIKRFSWKHFCRRITRENTQANAKYQTCRIFYKMRTKKKESEAIETHQPKRVKLLEQPLPLEESPDIPDKKEIRSILKKRFPGAQAEHLEKKTRVYVVRAENTEENTGDAPAFKYFSANRILPEELPNK